MNVFNTPNSLLVITSYPNPKNNKYGKRCLNAVAWHSEKTLRGLAKNRRVIVLAEKTNKDDQSFYASKNLFIKRVWNKKNPFSILFLALEILKFEYIKSIFIPFEFNVFGGTIPNLLFLIVLGIMKLKGKNIVIEVHQVIEDIKKLAKHINITNPLFQRFYNVSLKIYYFLFGLLASKIIVFEEKLKMRLEKYINPEKIKTLSLSAQINKTINKNYARNKLNLHRKDFIVLIFGYINGYKGIDFAIEAFSNIKNRNIKLVIAGGENPYLRDKKFYQKFYRKIINLGKNNNKVIMTGFVPDEKVKLYFSAADLIALPYEVFMSASGPFSLALSYGKPMILSNKLISYKESNDFKLSLEQTGLKSQEIFFPLKKEAILSLIKKVKNSQELTKKLTLFSKNLAEKRSLDKITDRYEKILAPDLDLSFDKVKIKRLKLVYN